MLASIRKILVDFCSSIQHRMSSSLVSQTYRLAIQGLECERPPSENSRKLGVSEAAVWETQKIFESCEQVRQAVVEEMRMPNVERFVVKSPRANLWRRPGNQWVAQLRVLLWQMPIDVWPSGFLKAGTFWPSAALITRSFPTTLISSLRRFATDCQLVSRQEQFSAAALHQQLRP